MFRKELVGNAQFDNEIYAIGQKVHVKFLDAALSNIENGTLGSIYKLLNSHWFDSTRTSLIWYSCLMVGGNPENTIIPSLILSLSGCGTGIHDDIIDKTKYKRLKRTIPNLYGSNNALVAGDLLIVKGLMQFKLLLDNIENDKIKNIMQVYEDFYAEMCIGEIWEINANKNLNLELGEYDKYLWKLGVDAEACTKIGAIIGGANPEEVNNLALFGRSIGYLNRLKDEIWDTLNLEGNIENRLLNESIPLTLLFASKLSEEYYKKIEYMLHFKKFTKGFAKKIVEISFDSKAIDYILEKAQNTTLQATNSLNTFPDNDAKNVLLYLLDSINKLMDI